MTPKEKAEELIDKYKFVEIANYSSIFEVKQCALITIDEILLAIQFNMYDEDAYALEEKYWQEVKKEIENL